jgi:hypothetical protein
MLSGIAMVPTACVFLAGPGCSGKTATTGTPAGAQSGAKEVQFKASPGPRLSLQNATKVDLLFDIDNSSSMGDKQAYLAEAIPDLVRRLVTPNCVDAAGNPTGEVSDVNGNCTTGKVEYPPVHDMHIGVVTSSLGPRLGNQCQATEMQKTSQGLIPRHNDDQGHLINRGSDPDNLSNYAESPIADMGTANFLSWFPSVPANRGHATTAGAPAIGDPAQLEKDFASLVVGTHQFGCGIESQLESWYRFLVQPDPYASLGTVGCGRNLCAAWDGVDTTILRQRADFLRPDSLVAVVVLTDENDSEVDVRSFNRTAWNFMTSPGFNPPRGTSICLTNPGDPGCTSCAFGRNGGDPQCETENGTYFDPHDWGYDLNLRHVHEQQKYGISIQYPLERYVIGLASAMVPDRNGEYPPGEMITMGTGYQGLETSNQHCNNPLFAAKLPAPPADVDPGKWQPTSDELCHLTPGPRGAGSVYYLHIGGVPHQLLQLDPRNPDSPQKTNLSTSDWTLILGKDPLNYDYTGIDPHMIEDYKPRTGHPVPAGGFPVAAPTSSEGTDPISGREWITNSAAPNGEHQGLLVDREYACVFKLDKPRDCSDAATMADPTLIDACDCQPPNPNTGLFTANEVPAVCNGATPTQQDYAKVYPTIRELLLAKLLGDVPGANPGVVSSMCPIHAVEKTPGDPLYGYRPAIAALIDRCKGP